MSVRVLHVSASFPRTVTDTTAPFLLDLVTGQRAVGWEPFVVAAHDHDLPRRHELAGVRVRRVRYGPDRWEVLVYRGGGHGRLRSPLHALLLPGLVAALTAAVTAEIRRTKPDVVHGHWLFPGGLIAALLPRRASRRVVITLHGPDVELASGTFGPLARWVVKRADAVLAVSEPLARRAEQLLRLPAGAIGVARLPLPLGVTPTPLPPIERRRLLAAGRASVEKGFDVLIDALARPVAADWDATLVTDGPERSNLVALAHSKGLDDRVTFRPLCPRAELFDLVRAHHAVAVPSRAEGLGMMALEALALGRPVVASAVGGLVEVVRDGADGLLVPPGDADALARALARLDLRAPAAHAVEHHQARAVVDAHAQAYGVAVPSVLAMRGQ